MFQKSRNVLFIGGVLALMASTACYRFELGSIWADGSIAVDGDDSDWTLPRRVLEDGIGAVGFMNDETYLYISYRTANQVRIQQIVTQGLTIWIDPKGGSSKQIGFRYPIGSKPLGISPWDYDPRPRTTGYQAFLDHLLRLQPGIEILGSKREDVALVPLENQIGVQLKVQWTRELFVYEMRVPYRKNSQLPHPIGTSPGRKIGIGITGGPAQIDNGAKRMGSLDTGVEDPMRSQGPGQRMGPPGTGPLETWITVTLATEQ
jgi:hypothetical protein